MAFSINPVTLSVGIEDVQKRFKEMAEQAQEMELKKLQIFQALPLGYVPKFNQGPLGSSHVTIENVGIEDPRVKTQLAIEQEKARIESQAAEEAAQRSTTKSLELSAKKQQADTVLQATGTLTSLDTQLQNETSPTARQELIRNAIPTIAQYARTVGGAYKIPGLTQFVSKYQSDIEKAQQSFRAAPAEAASAAGTPAQPEAGQASTFDSVLASPNGIKNKQILSERGLTGKALDEAAVRATLTATLTQAGVPQNQVSDLVEKAVNPGAAAREERIKGKQEQALDLSIEEAQQRLNKQQTGVDAAVAALKEAGVTEEIGRQIANDTAKTVAGDPNSPIHSATVEVLDPKTGKPTKADLLVATTPDLSNDAENLPKATELINKAIKTTESKGIPKDIAARAARAGLDEPLHGEGKHPGLVTGVKERMAQFSGTEANGDLNVSGNALVLRPGAIDKNGNVYTRESVNAQGQPLGAGSVSNTAKGLVNMAQFLNAAEGTDIQKVWLTPSVKPSPEALKAIGGKMLKGGIVEIPVNPKGARTTSMSAGPTNPAQRMAVNAALTGGALGAQANVTAMNAALGTVTASAKDKQAKAEAAVTVVNDNYDKMTEKEQTNAQDVWKKRRTAWKNLKITDATLKDMNEAVGLPRNDGFEEQ